MRNLRFRGGAFVGHPFKQQVPQAKGAVSGNKGGHSGGRIKRIATGLPGSANGLCIKMQGKACHCGGCGA